MQLAAFRRRTAEMLTELRHHPIARGAATAATVAAAGRCMQRPRGGLDRRHRSRILEASLLAAWPAWTRMCATRRTRP